MTPPRSLITVIAENRRLRPVWRRAILVAAVLLCAVLTLFPERYRASTTLTPSDPSSLGLGGALGQLGAINSVFGAQSQVEISLRVTRSVQVRDAVTNHLGLMQRLHFEDRQKAERWLDRNVEVRALRGGIVQIDMLSRDPALAREIVGAYSDATRAQLGEISRQQTAYKRKILEQLVDQANDRLTRAQAAYDTFRLGTRYSQPGSSIEAIGARIPLLQGAIKAKEVALAAQRQFATDDNMQVRQILAELDALHAQLRIAEATDPDQSNSVGRVVRQSTQAQKLERELNIAQGLFDSYRRFLQGTSVEDLTSSASVRILEPPYIDSARQINFGPLGIGLIILVLGIGIEMYHLRPPIGVRRDEVIA